MKWCFQRNNISKIIHFGILIHALPWRQQKHKCLCFHYWDYLTNFWRNNWRFIVDAVERLCSCNNYYEICQRKVLGIFSSLVSVKLNGKGQLISKCLFGVFNSSKNEREINFWPSLLEQKFFVRFLEKFENRKVLSKLSDL